MYSLGLGPVTESLLKQVYPTDILAPKIESLSMESLMSMSLICWELNCIIETKKYIRNNATSLQFN